MKNHIRINPVLKVEEIIYLDENKKTTNFLKIYDVAREESIWFNKNDALLLLEKLKNEIDKM
jgi:hypothetical protein